MTHQWQISSEQPELARHLGAELSIHPALAQTLINRGLVTSEAARLFLHPELKSLSHPMELPGVDKASSHLANAILSNKIIGIYGDYDADGLTSTALFVCFMAELGLVSPAFIPNRLLHGYGLNPEGFEALKQAGAQVVVSADCGTSDYEAIDYAKKLGLELILTDHHQLGPKFPDVDAFVNPCSPGSPDAFKGLSGVGVLFFVLMAVRIKLRDNGGFNNRPEPNMKRFLDFVALGTIADVSPMTAMNRAMIKTGLVEMSQRPRPGLEALGKVAKINDQITARDVLFGLAPRINAAGRLGATDTALNLLTQTGHAEAKNLANELNQLNSERQKVERRVLGQAHEVIKSDGGLESKSAIVVAGHDWHKGVLGIVASRLARKHNRPSIVLSISDGVAVGSGRSIETVQLHRILGRMERYLIRYGGHSQAAGLKIEADHIPAFTQAFDAEVGRTLASVDIRPVIIIDATLDLDDLCESLLIDLERLAPFGSGNPEPTFVARDVGLSSIKKVGQDRAHLACTVRQGRNSWPAIGFDFGQEANRYSSRAHIAYRPFLDSFRGINRIKIQILSLQAA